MFESPQSYQNGSYILLELKNVRQLCLSLPRVAAIFNEILRGKRCWQVKSRKERKFV